MMTASLDFSNDVASDRGAWERAAAKAAGGDLETLAKTTAWGAASMALAGRDDRPASRPPRPRPGWEIAEAFALKDEAVADAVAAAREDGVGLALLEGDALNDATCEALAGLAQKPRFALTIGGATWDQADRLATWSGAVVDAFADPFADWAAGGAASLETRLARAAERAAAQDGLAAIGDGRPWFDAGGAIDQALGLALSSAVASARAFLDEGVAPERAFARIGLAIPLDAHLFDGVAALRAARLLWRKIAAAAGAADAAAATRLIGEEATRDRSAFDPATDHLRATAAAMAGAIGGADVMFSARASDPTWRRIARNAQFLARDEARLAVVADPAAGSFWLERRTASLAEATWRRVQAIEAAGGLQRALAAGLPQSWVGEAARERALAIEGGDRVLVGVNAFRAPGERRAPVIESAFAGAGTVLAPQRIDAAPSGEETGE